MATPGASGERPALWAKVIDHSTCIGCHACTVACKSEHLVPLGVNRTYVKQVEVGVFPSVRRQFQVTRCNQCDDAPCVPICPVTAMARRPDGIVDFDTERCIGCKACMAACPYDAIYIDPESKAAEKCNFCAHRIDQGMEPACVVVCPTEAIVVGDLRDPDSPVNRYLGREKLSVRKPEKGTRPKLFYKEAGEATLAPTAARYAGTHAAAEQQQGYPVGNGAGRAPGDPLVAYEVPHGPPWGWMVSAYTWTKSIAAGVFALLGALFLAGFGFGAEWFGATAVVGGLFLGATGALLVGDLTLPRRFLWVLTRPQWRSWLTRGAYILLAYSLVLAGAFAAFLLDGGEAALRALAIAGIPTGLMAAVYTAFLFAQARGRDLWQSPLLPLHLTVQAALAGAAGLLLMGSVMALPAGAGEALRWILVASCLLHGLLALSDLMIPHASRDLEQAVGHLARGRFRGFFWGGVAFGALLPAALAIASGQPVVVAAAAILALAGLLASEHAYVQAGQSVPLA